METYFEAKSKVSVQAHCKNNFRGRNHPGKKLMYRWIHKFRTHETILNQESRCTEEPLSGLPKCSKTPDNVKVVSDSAVRSLRKSLRRQIKELGISRKSVTKILVKNLQLHSCSIQIKHKFIQADMRIV